MLSFQVYFVVLHLEPPLHLSYAPLLHKRRGSWGFVVRAENGQTVLAGEGNLNAVQDALCPEAEACLAAPTATMSRGMSNIVFELDSPNK